MSSGFDPQKTQPLNPEQSPSDPNSQRTQFIPPNYSPPNPDLNRTQHYAPHPPISEGQGFDPKRTQVVGTGGGANFDPLRTQIYQGPGVTPQMRPVPQNRKIVGWLISFTIHPNGVDFRLYEGRNTIGSDPKCDITLNDPGASGHHMTILYRAGQFLFRDELSTNGTFINGEMLNEGKLNDGDIIRIGKTELRFRTV
ncbi:MAG: FHA domain-containing protein [Bacteroidia bacterium]|nr:FHA domain-containing protein [Bacteroidia bacterium]